MKEYLKKYYAIRHEVEDKCAQLWGEHKSHMECKEGCSSCCQAFKILPVEYEAIRQAIQDKDIQVNTEAKPDQCKFLINNKCSIYEARPIICRTHGYPLYRLNDEVEAYEVSHCPLNFNDFAFEDFNAENMYPEDLYNSKLYMLNKAYVESMPERGIKPIELVEVNGLAG